MNTSISKMEQSKLEKLFQSALSLHRAEKYVDAIKKYKALLTNQPNRIDVLQNLGSALYQISACSASQVVYEKALKLDNNSSALWSNYGNLLYKMKKFDLAEKAHQKALKISPRDAGNWYNSGNIPFATNQPEKAISRYNESLKLSPDYHKATWNRALCYLQLEQWKKGFSDYEARLTLYPQIRSNLAAKRWNGESLDNKTILLTCEQGFGDMLQWARFISLLKSRYQCKIILECRKEIRQLMTFVDGVDQTVNREDKKPFYDFHFPLMSLPAIGKWSEHEFLHLSPYLKPHFNEDWQLLETLIKIRQDSNKKIGIVWKSKPTPYDRSCPLTEFAPLFSSIDHVSYYSLQFGDDNQELYQTGMDLFIHDVSDSINSFTDTARLMLEMDLIITVDSASAHLAGALNIPCWIMLLHYSDWKWGLNREDSAWYPNTLLFRQDESQTWESVVTKMQLSLKSL
jgi:Tfp pilus assembly protein PilF